MKRWTFYGKAVSLMKRNFRNYVGLISVPHINKICIRVYDNQSDTIHACLMRQLTINNTLEFYDVPQILTASDATGTRYLCTLYSQEAAGYNYLGVQISEPRLMAFLGGQLDLREAYLHPEFENALYVVKDEKENLIATTMLQPSELTESMLPEADYFFNAPCVIK